MTYRKVRFVGGAIFWLLLLSGRGLFAADHPIGTVFFSPAERAALVAGRHGGSADHVDDAGKSADQEREGVEEAPKSLPVAVTGIVSRSDGKSVVWLNGKPVAESANDSSLPGLRLSRDHVVIDGKPVKVGETLDIISGERLSPLPAGAVKIAPPGITPRITP